MSSMIKTHQGQTLMELIFVLASLLVIAPPLIELILSHWNRMACQVRAFKTGTQKLKTEPQKSSENIWEIQVCEKIKVQIPLQSLENVGL